MSAPLTPAGCDLRDFPRMMIDIPRLFSSEFDATDNDTAWRYGVTLWLKSFHQVPAASLPDDDRQLAKLCGLGRDVGTWKAIREEALRGWLKAEDGLLYHAVVAEMALECWIDKLLARVSGGVGNARRWKVQFDPAPICADLEEAGACLARLNPISRHVQRARRHETLAAAEEVVGTASPPDRQPIAKRSQGKGSEGIDIDLGASAEPTRAGERAKLGGWQSDSAFSEAWAACTDAMRRRSDGRAKTFPVWRRAAEAAGGGGALVQALRRYLREDPDVQRTGGPGFHRWLVDGAWEHWLPAPVDPAAIPESRWAVAIKLFNAGEPWPDTYGPAPGQPGCMAPTHLLPSAQVLRLRSRA